jgi:hypothetical protein
MVFQKLDYFIGFWHGKTPNNEKLKEKRSAKGHLDALYAWWLKRPLDISSWNASSLSLGAK